MEATEKRETFSEIVNSGKTVLVDFLRGMVRPLQNDAADSKRTHCHGG